MATLIPGTFGKYIFDTSQEELQSHIIQPFMLYKLQNELSAAAEELINIRSGDFSPQDIERKVIYLQARMDFITDLIQDDKVAKEEMENVRQQLDQQPARVQPAANIWNFQRTEPEQPSETQNAAIDFNRKN